MSPPPGNTEAIIGFALFVASEVVAMSSLKSNSILQILLHLAQELFPYEIERKAPPSRRNRPRLPRPPWRR